MNASSKPDRPLAQRLAARIETLRAEFALGERRLAALDAERRDIRDTLLRVSGALQVLREELGEARTGADAPPAACGTAWSGEAAPDRAAMS